MFPKYTSGTSLKTRNLLDGCLMGKEEVTDAYVQTY